MPHALRPLFVMLAACALLGGCASKEDPPESADAPSDEAPAAKPAQNQPAEERPAQVNVKSPEAVVKAYLQLGSEGDLSRIRELVDPACHATKIGDADAVKLLGARMTLSDVVAEVESSADGTAVVKYTVKGSVDSDGARSETNIFGKRVDVQVGKMHMTGVSQSGQLKLQKVAGRWVIGC